jgi:hypothetical protein
VAFALKDQAVTRLIEVQQVLRADTMVLSVIDGVIVLNVSEEDMADALVDEAGGLAEALLLTVELGDTKLTLGPEGLCVISVTQGSRVLTLEPLSVSRY